MSDPRAARAEERDEEGEEDVVVDGDAEVAADEDAEEPDPLDAPEAMRARSRTALERAFGGGGPGAGGARAAPAVVGDVDRVAAAPVPGAGGVAGGAAGGASQAPEVVVATPEAVTFEETAVGQESEPKTVTITNGRATPVDIADVVELGGGPDSAFVTYGGAMSGPLEAGQSVQIQVAFRPTVGGAHAAQFQVLNASGAAVGWFSARGTAVSNERSELPRLKAQPRKLTFPRTDAGEFSEPKEVGLTNRGRQPVLVERVDVEGEKATADDFQVGGASTGAVEPGATAQVQVVFHPKRKGRYKARLVFRANQGATAATVMVRGESRKGKPKTEEQLAQEDSAKRLKAVAKGLPAGATDTYREMLASLLAAQQLTEAGDPQSYARARALVAPVDERLAALSPKLDGLLRDYGSAQLAGTSTFGRAHASVWEWKRRLDDGASINADYMLGAFQGAEEPIKLTTGELTEAPSLRALDESGTRMAIGTTAAVGAVIAAPFVIKAIPVVIAEGAMVWASAKWIGTELVVWALANPETAVVLSEVLVGLGLQIGEGGWEDFARQFESPDGVLMFLAQLMTDAGQLHEASSGRPRGQGADAPDVDAPQGNSGRRTPGGDDGGGGGGQRRAPETDVDGAAPGRPRAADATADLSPEAAATIKKGSSRAREIIETITAFVRGGAKNPTASRATPEHHAERAQQVRATVTDALGEQGVDKAAFRTEVLDDKKFEKRFGSERGQAVTVIENGVPVVYARPGASDADLQHEATHIAQLRDASNPQIQQDVRILSGETMKQWKKADAGLRKELLERKLRVEIDAAERELAVATPDARVELEDRLANLRLQQAEVESLTDVDLAKINAGVFERPELLEDPAYLFAKGPREAVDGEKQSPFALREKKHAEVEVTDSPAKKLGKVVQLGQEWTEAVIVTTTYPGVVSIDRHKKAGAIVVHLDHEDTRHSYVVEADAKLQVKDGDRLAAGDVLAHEKSRKHRLVEIKDDSGNVVDTRTEEWVKNRWQQSGEHSRARGEIAEHAARRQIDAELEAEMRRQGDDADADGVAAGQAGEGKRAPLTGHGRIDNQTGSGSGFDDVVIEFRGSGDALDATVRIVETKEYPNRTVPLGDMTAIRNNLAKNLERLRAQVSAGRAAAIRSNDGVHGGMTVEQYDAVQRALDEGNIKFELRLGATTSVSPSALEQLRTEIDGQFGQGTFQGSAAIDQVHVDAAIREKYDENGDRR